MTLDEIEKYKRLYAYRHTYLSGAATILNNFFGLPPERPVPLTLSHGVDFGHCYSPMDINSFEPIYWAYNQIIHSQASAIKPCLLLPHPWIMLMTKHGVAQGHGTLVIGPPPGPENDQRLLDAISKYITGNVTVLVKARGNYRGSELFWKAHGIDTICADQTPGRFYLSLFHLISRYRRIVAGTFSSALIYAAAMHKEVQLIRGYRYRSYFPVDYLSIVDFDSARAKSVVNTFCCANDHAKRHCALSLLGGDLSSDRADLLRGFVNAVEGIRVACYGHQTIPLPMRRLVFYSAAKFRVPGIARFDQSVIKKAMGLHRVLIGDINELSIWLQGMNSDNFVCNNVRYVTHVTEPGTAVSQYTPAADEFRAT